MSSRLIIVIFIVALIALACQPKPAQIELGYQNLAWPRGRKYEIVHVEGMPCVLITGYKEAGISCDWSKWHGE